MLRKLFLCVALIAGTVIVPAVATQTADAAPYRHGRVVYRGCYPAHYHHGYYCR
jgi:hypothetical protein